MSPERARVHTRHPPHRTPLTPFCPLEGQEDQEGQGSGVQGDTNPAPLTPWSAGAPSLSPEQSRERAEIGFVPTRRQVLAGYRYPQGDVVEGQIPRARRKLGAGATVAQIADRLATHPGDREFLAALFGAYDVHVDLPEKKERHGPRNDG